MIILFFSLSLILLTNHQPTHLPLLYLPYDFQYLGSFRLPSSQFGVSEMNFAQGPFELNQKTKNSIFIVGHAHQQAIGEFTIPKIINSKNVADLIIADDPIQNFVYILNRGTIETNDTENIDRIGGIGYIDDKVKGKQELIINTYEYYDAPGDNTISTLLLRNPDDLENSIIDGYYKFKGTPPAHVSGWISPIPDEWQEILGGSYISGHSSGIPIIGRCTVGPSAFSFYPSDIVGENYFGNEEINCTKLLDFSLTNRLHEDLSNKKKKNNLWTHLSRANYGFIPPGSRTYVTLGDSGGHMSGVCYKCVQDNGNLCGGYCSRTASDNYLYYWLWDLNDLIDVKEGRIESYDVRPYSYGKFPSYFGTHTFGGGSFDYENEILYISLPAADRLQGTYSNPPIIVAYKIKRVSHVVFTVSILLGSGLCVVFLCFLLFSICLILSFTLKCNKDTNDTYKKTVK